MSRHMTKDEKRDTDGYVQCGHFVYDEGGKRMCKRNATWINDAGKRRCAWHRSDASPLTARATRQPPTERMR